MHWSTFHQEFPKCPSKPQKCVRQIIPNLEFVEKLMNKFYHTIKIVVLKKFNLICNITCYYIDYVLSGYFATNHELSPPIFRTAGPGQISALSIIHIDMTQLVWNYSIKRIVIFFIFFIIPLQGGLSRITEIRTTKMIPQTWLYWYKLPYWF